MGAQGPLGVRAPRGQAQPAALHVVPLDRLRVAAVRPALAAARLRGRLDQRRRGGGRRPLDRPRRAPPATIRRIARRCTGRVSVDRRRLRRHRAGQPARASARRRASCSSAGCCWSPSSAASPRSCRSTRRSRLPWPAIARRARRRLCLPPAEAVAATTATCGRARRAGRRARDPRRAARAAPPAGDAQRRRRDVAASRAFFSPADAAAIVSKLRPCVYLPGDVVLENDARQLLRFIARGRACCSRPTAASSCSGSGRATLSVACLLAEARSRARASCAAPRSTASSSPRPTCAPRCTRTRRARRARAARARGAELRLSIHARITADIANHANLCARIAHGRTGGRRAQAGVARAPTPATRAGARRRRAPRRARTRARARAARARAGRTRGGRRARARSSSSARAPLNRSPGSGPARVSAGGGSGGGGAAAAVASRRKQRVAPDRRHPSADSA